MSFEVRPLREFLVKPALPAALERLLQDDRAAPSILAGEGSHTLNWRRAVRLADERALRDVLDRLIRPAARRT